MSYRTSSASTQFAHVRGSKLRVWPLIDLFRQRKQLSELSDDQLEDIGVTQAEAKREAARPVWDVPSHWLR